MADDRALAARKRLIKGLRYQDIAEAWLTATDHGEKASDTVVVVADPNDHLGKQFLERGMAGKEWDPAKPKIAAVPGEIGSWLCQASENEEMSERVKLPPDADEGHVAFWLAVVSHGGITLLPVQLEAGE